MRSSRALASNIMFLTVLEPKTTRLTSGSPGASSRLCHTLGYSSGTPGRYHPLTLSCFIGPHASSLSLASLAAQMEALSRPSGLTAPITCGPRNHTKDDPNTSYQGIELSYPCIPINHNLQAPTASRDSMSSGRFSAQPICISALPTYPTTEAVALHEAAATSSPSGKSHVPSTSTCWTQI